MSELCLQERQGSVAILTLNRPERKNAMTPALNGALIEALDALAKDREIGAIVLTGAGGAFSSGLDLKEATTYDPTQIEETARRYFNGMIQRVRRQPQPIIAAVDGVAVGFGMGLAMACDLRIASERARFTQSFAKIGLVPDGGSTWFLPRLLGTAKALELIYTAQDLHADEALRLGLCSRVVKVEELLPTAVALAERIAKNSPLANQQARQLVFGSLESSLDQALDREMSVQMEMLRTEDFMEGLTAFMMKRPPEFKGR